MSSSSLVRTARIAAHALRRNKLRSSLTALGIVIGVAAVVSMVAVGNGAQANITKQVSALGENLLMVFAGNRRAAGVSSGLGGASTLTLDDLQAIVRELPDVARASPEISSSAQVVAGGRNWSTSVVGVSPDYLQIRNWKLAAGSPISEREVRTAAKVALIGSKTSAELFGPLDPVGQTVRVGNIPFTIIGRLESKGAGLGGQNQDDRLVVPYTTAMKRITGDRHLRSINLEIASADRMAAAQAQLTALLRQRHRLPAGRADDFNILNQKDVADTVGSVTTVVKLLLGAISSLSLLVGGIGIMNIMLVSVTERTREIGTRMAVGARPSAIQLQFLTEAVMLSLFGGLAGVALGVGISLQVGRMSTFEPIVTTQSILLAFGVSFTIGVFFGYYPARKAAALDPIDALRHE